jgi:hypothetical protein
MMPKGTKISRCVEDLLRKGHSKVSAIKICQDSTGMSYASGKSSKAKAAKKKASMKKRKK